MNKKFDQVTLELPEINLSEEKGRYGFGYGGYTNDQISASFHTSAFGTPLDAALGGYGGQAANDGYVGSQGSIANGEYQCRGCYYHNAMRQGGNGHYHKGEDGARTANSILHYFGVGSHNDSIRTPR